MSGGGVIMNDTFITSTVDNFQATVYISYLVSGSIAASSNFVVALLILIYKSLRRKELLILVGLAIGDVIYGIGYLIGGAQRLYLVLNNQHTKYVSPWHCQLEPATFFYIYGPQLSSIMNVVISVDRLMAVAFSSKYQSLTPRYVLLVTIGACLLVAISYFTGFVLSATMPDTPTVLALCLSTQASRPIYGTFYTSLITTCNCASIVVFSVVLIMVKFRAKNAAEGSMYTIQQKRQMKITKIIGIITLLDFLLDVIPWTIQTSVNASHLPDTISKIVSPVTWVIIECKRIITVVVYMWQLKDLRKAFKLLIRCKLKQCQVETVKCRNMESRL